MFARTFAAAGLAVAALLSAGSAAAVTYAAEVRVDWGDDPYRAGPTDRNPARYDPASALSGSSFFRMGLGSRAIFGWGGRPIGGGAIIFETTGGCRATNVDPIFGTTVCSNFREQVEVFAIGSGFTLPEAGTGAAFDAPFGPDRETFEFDFAGVAVTSLGFLGNATASRTGGAFALPDDVFYIMLQDRSTELANANSNDGFDIRSVAVERVGTVPLPAGLPMLVAAIGLMGLARRRLA